MHGSDEVMRSLVLIILASIVILSIIPIVENQASSHQIFEDSLSWNPQTIGIVGFIHMDIKETPSHNECKLNTPARPILHPISEYKGFGYTIVSSHPSIANLHGSLVSFTESGLPVNTTWCIKVSGLPTYTVLSGETCALYLASGKYTYEVFSCNKDYAPEYSGSFNVTGQSLYINIPFIPVKYNVTFREMGLKTPLAWYIDIDEHSNSSTIILGSYTILLMNGTYSFSAYSHCYEPVSGKFTVSGNNYGVIVEFKPEGTSEPGGSFSLYAYFSLVIASSYITAIIFVVEKRINGRR